MTILDTETQKFSVSILEEKLTYIQRQRMFFTGLYIIAKEGINLNIHELENGCINYGTHDGI